LALNGPPIGITQTANNRLVKELPVGSVTVAASTQDYDPDRVTKAVKQSKR